MQHTQTLGCTQRHVTHIHTHTHTHTRTHAHTHYTTLHYTHLNAYLTYATPHPHVHTDMLSYIPHADACMHAHTSTKILRLVELLNIG